MGGMASKNSSSSSRSRTAESSSAHSAEQAAKTASVASQAGTAGGQNGMQQAFDQWLNAWRSVAYPAQRAKVTKAMNPQANASTFVGNGAMPNPFANFGAMPQMPDLSKMNGMAEFASLRAAYRASARPCRACPLCRKSRPRPFRRKSCINCKAIIRAMLPNCSGRRSAQNIDPSAIKDRRFADTMWQSTPAYAFTAAWYLLNERYLQEFADAVQSDPKTRERIRFTVQQWAASPSNYFALNPDAQKTLIESKGESLRQGMMNLLGDMQRGKISQSDESRFMIGKNVASPEGSLVRYALEQGQQVFIISWRNANQSIAHKSWDDYVQEGVLESTGVAKNISGKEQIKYAGLLHRWDHSGGADCCEGARQRPSGFHDAAHAHSRLLGHRRARRLCDEAHVQMREQTIGGRNGTPPGLMCGIEFANAFSYLRPNDLVWNYVVDNYLKGRMPQAFDLLFWNSESTNLPVRCASGIYATRIWKTS